MEQTTALEINLFGEQLPSMDQLRALSRAIHSSEANQMKFAEQFATHQASTSANAVLAVGIGLFMLKRYAEAAEKLKKGRDCLEKFNYLALAMRQCNKPKDAIDCLQKARLLGAEPLAVNLEKAAS